MQQHEWKDKLHKIVKECQEELSKATVIGKKMINASQTNSDLKNAHEELGKLAAKHLKSGILEWENPRVNELLEDINRCQKDLQIIEKEVQDIKVK